MIKLQNIHKQFGDTEVLKGIDLEIKQGEIIVIIGSSGTGKSTLLRCVNFLEQADQGTISIDDIKVDTQKHTKAEVLALRRKTGFVFQNPICCVCLQLDPQYIALSAVVNTKFRDNFAG